jgi:hypothetical protein
MLENFFFIYLFIYLLLFNFLHSISDYGTSINFDLWFDFEQQFWSKPKDVMIPKPK